MDVDASVAANDTCLPSGRVWITSFWGFSPESEGYLGFTREGDRTWFLRQHRPGDLVMIYGTMGNDTEEAMRGRVLGFLEVEPRTTRDVARMSPAGRRWKQDNGLSDRWTFAVPVARAWRATDLPDVRAIAPLTLGPGANFQLIASRGVPLTPEEAGSALSVQVRPVDVFGEAPMFEEERERVYVPSRGFPMAFGRRASETTDDAHFLYALQLEGNAALVLGEPAYLLRGKVIIKVGLSKNPNTRCAELNSSLPPAAKLRWKPLLQSRPLSDGEAALKAETALKDRFSRAHRSLGGEFFLCDERTLAGEFASL